MAIGRSQVSRFCTKVGGKVQLHQDFLRSERNPQRAIAKGEQAMKSDLHYNRETNVAYVDVRTEVSCDIRIDVIDVTQNLGLKTQVLARVDENGQLLGIVIHDYPAFKRELRRKYLAFAVEKLLDLLISKVRELTSRQEGCSDSPRLMAHA
jgi:hypothetical protein